MANFRVTAKTTNDGTRVVNIAADDRNKAVERSLEEGETLEKLEKKVDGTFQDITETATTRGGRDANAASAAPASAGILMFAGIAGAAIGVLGSFYWMTVAPILGIYIAIASVVGGAMIYGFGKIIALLNSIYGVLAQQSKNGAHRA